VSGSKFLFVLLPIGCLGIWFATHHSPGTSLTLLEANRQKILLMQVGSDPSTLDPHLAQGIPERKIITGLLEGLVSDDPKDNTHQLPGVAESWEHNDDFSVWTFHLRNNARWSNGDPVTAHDFVFSLHRALSPKFGAPFSEFLYILKNAESYHKGRISDFAEVGVQALDPLTLRFNLAGPTPYFTSALSNYVWFPVHPATILRFGRMDAREAAWTLPGNYVGNGPFILKTWRKNDVLQLAKNPYYWDRGNVRLNGVNFYSIEDLNTADRAFRAGQLHATNDIPLARIPTYRRDQPDRIRIEPFLGVYFYKLNVFQKPLDNVKVRRALDLSIDREALVKNVLRAGQQPATGYCPPGMADYPALNVVSFDPDKARQQLAEAGYPNGHNFPKLRLLVNTSESHRSIAEAIQQMWKEYLNIQVEIENQEWKVYLNSMGQMNYQIARNGWIGPFPDPLAFLGGFTTGNPNNSTHWANPHYDELLRKAALESERASRLELLRQAEELLVSEAPVLPIYWYTRVYLLDPSVQGWSAQLQDSHPYKYLDLEAPL
jgi:oligopeptide transport system substrate-binding protein